MLALLRTPVQLYELVYKLNLPPHTTAKITALCLSCAADSRPGKTCQESYSNGQVHQDHIHCHTPGLARWGASRSCMHKQGEQGIKGTCNMGRSHLFPDWWLTALGLLAVDGQHFVNKGTHSGNVLCIYLARISWQVTKESLAGHASHTCT